MTIISMPYSRKGAENHERIFGKKVKCSFCGHENVRKDMVEVVFESGVQLVCNGCSLGRERRPDGGLDE